MIRDAYRFILPLLALIAACLYFNLSTIAAILAGLVCFIVYFFRNPTRIIPAGEHLILSPADGKVVRVAALPEKDSELPGGQSVSIFLNIFNVHVTRAPIRGVLETFEYRRGKFRAAYAAEASRANEQNILVLRGENIRVTVKQIAGFIARRVVCWKRPGDSLERGELIGLIRFGSRVDILMPGEVKILVKVGDRVKGGSSAIAEVR